MKLEIPVSPEQRWEWIKYQLRRDGSSLSRLAVELGVSASAPQLTKYTPYPRIERAIAKKLGLSPLEIWPERWNADGTPCRQRPNRAESCAVGRKSGEAAHICAQDSGSNAIAHRQLARED
ncbi:helix-turn-helix domain-containing protein [Halomonas sp.]|uniref:helix-turn-helix domain-containing protein n=1 Tax=Halomonas sp. TaxID=1486246 RepID=UPI00298D9A5C|nr:helix-turn-helix domain-containing protein [Halomonas sp.]MDW7748964.1 helix-turn-helix domain-containing protein [Halomonas sp.]